MRKIIFQTDDKRLFSGESPSLDKKWLNAIVYQTSQSTYEVIMEYWDSKDASSQEVLFSDFKDREGAIIAAKIALREALSNLN